MEFRKINSFFYRFSRFQVKYRLPVIFFMLIFTLFSLSGLRKITFTSEDGRILSEEEKAAQKRFKEAFSSDILMILIAADDVFSPDVLQAVKELGSRLEYELPAVENVYSLVTIPLPFGSEDEIKITNPFQEEKGINRDPAELKKIKELFLSRQSMVNVFYSEDAKECWLIATLNDINDIMHIRDMQAEKIILEEAEKFKDVCLMNPVGTSYFYMECRLFARKEAVSRILLGCIAVVLIFIILLRSVRAVISSFLISIFSISSVFGIFGHLGVHIDLEAVSLPVLLGMALAVGYSVHIINSFKLHFRRSGKRKEAVYAAVEETGWPLLFTMLTTITAFISFFFFDMTIIRWIGFSSSGVILSVYIYVVTLIPSIMSFGKDGKEDSSADSKGATKIDIFFGRFGNIVIEKKMFIIAAAIIITILMIPGIFKIDLNMNLLEMQGPKVPHVARMKKLLDYQLGNIYSYDLMIEFDNPDAFKDSSRILKLEELQRRAGQLKLVKKTYGKARVRSACDMLKEINRMFNNDNPDFYRIDTEEGVIAQNLVFFSDCFNSYFDISNDDFGITRLQIDITDFDSKQILEDTDRLKGWAKELFPEAKVSANGIIIDYARSNDTLIKIELKSILCSLIFIAIMLIIAFGNVKTALIAMIPNISPVVILAGLMGYLNKPLDMLTVTVMPMILGLAVDDTIHLTNHIKKHFSACGDYKKAIYLSLQEIGKTMFMTSIILCSMFAVYLTSPMVFFVHTGLLSIIGVLTALVADYTLTPVLFFLVKAFGEGEKK